MGVGLLGGFFLFFFFVSLFMGGRGFCLVGLFCILLNYGRIEKKDKKQIPPSSALLGKADRFLILNAL